MALAMESSVLESCVSVSDMSEGSPLAGVKSEVSLMLSPGDGPSSRAPPPCTPTSPAFDLRGADAEDDEATWGSVAQAVSSNTTPSTHPGDAGIASHAAAAAASPSPLPRASAPRAGPRGSASPGPASPEDAEGELRTLRRTVEGLRDALALSESRCAEVLSRVGSLNAGLRKTVADQEERLSGLAFESYEREMVVQKLRQSSRVLLVYSARTVFDSEETLRKVLAQQAWVERENIALLMRLTRQCMALQASDAQKLADQIHRARLEATVTEQVNESSQLGQRLADSQALGDALRAELDRVSDRFHSTSPQRVPSKGVPPLPSRSRR